MVAKVIKLNRTNFHDFIDDLVKAYDEKRLNDFVCIVSHRNPKGKEREGFTASIGNYWFSGDDGSSVYSLGLVEMMKQKILNYIEDANEDC